MNGTDESTAKGISSGRLVAGVALLALGAMFVLDNYGLVNAGRIWDWWPIILIAMGLSHLVSGDAFAIAAGRKVILPRRGWGLVLLAAGVFLLLHNLHLVYWRWRAVWPVLLLLLGAILIWRSLRGPRSPSEPASAAGTLNEFAMLGGGVRAVRSRQFRGGQVSAILGGFTIDLREAELAPEGAAIDVFVLLGGVDFKVPERWNIAVRVSPVLGGADNRARTAVAPGEVAPTLTITGSVVLGGIDIKN